MLSHQDLRPKKSHNNFTETTGIMIAIPYAPMGPFCRWFWSGFWVSKHLLKGYLEHYGIIVLVVLSTSSSVVAGKTVAVVLILISIVLTIIVVVAVIGGGSHVSSGNSITIATMASIGLFQRALFFLWFFLILLLLVLMFYSCYLSQSATTFAVIVQSSS